MSSQLQRLIYTGGNTGGQGEKLRGLSGSSRKLVEGSQAAALLIRDAAIKEWLYLLNSE